MREKNRQHFDGVIAPLLAPCEYENDLRCFCVFCVRNRSGRETSQIYLLFPGLVNICVLFMALLSLLSFMLDYQGFSSRLVSCACCLTFAENKKVSCLSLKGLTPARAFPLLVSAMPCFTDGRPEFSFCLKPTKRPPCSYTNQSGTVS